MIQSASARAKNQLYPASIFYLKIYFGIFALFLIVRQRQEREDDMQ